MEFIKDVLNSLPTVATSPLALIGYVVAIAAWVTIVLKVQRNKNVLSHLKDLPAKDRLQALKDEMGVVPLKEGLSPEQYLKSRIYLYKFLAFAIICVTIVILFVVAITKTSHKPLPPQASITLDSEDADKPDAPQPAALGAVESAVRTDTSKPKITLAAGVSVLNTSENTVTYSYDRTGDTVQIKPEIPYLSLLKSGGPIDESGKFPLQFPKLSVKLANNTEYELFVDEAAVQVKSSMIDLEPVLRVVHLPNYDTFLFLNDGWGRVIDPEIRFGITEGEKYDKGPPWGAEDNTLSLGTFFEEKEVKVTDFIKPAILRPELLHDFHGRAQSAYSFACVFGQIRYSTETNELRSIKFKATVQLTGPVVSPAIRPNYLYDLFLRAGESGYTKRLPISQAIKPGEAENFDIRVGTDKTARFDLAISFRTTDGAQIPGNNVRLAIFVPRTQAPFIEARLPGTNQ